MNASAQSVAKAADAAAVSWGHEFNQIAVAIVALLWPLIALWILWKLLPSIRNIVESRRFSLKVAGMELSVQDATDKLQTQIEDLQQQVLALKGNSAARPDVAEPVAPESVLPKQGSVLWVDDRPSNNAFEIAQLRNQGVNVVLATSTKEGRAIVHGQSFDAIISDMGRDEDGAYNGKAGIDLVSQLREDGDQTPFIVYTTSKYAQRHGDQIKEAGGERAISSQVELLEWLRQRTASKSG